jgi:hypothetical protein
MRKVSAKRGGCIMTTHQLIPRNWFKLSGQTQHFCGSTGSLLSRHGSLRFLAVPPPENAAERGSIWVMRRHYAEHDGQAVLHSQNRIPKMLRTMAERLGVVCCQKETTSKWIRVADLQACKCIFPDQRSDTFWTALVNCSWFSHSDLIFERQLFRVILWLKEALGKEFY